MTEDKVRAAFKIADELASEATKRSDCYREVFCRVFDALTRPEWEWPLNTTAAASNLVRDPSRPPNT